MEPINWGIILPVIIIQMVLMAIALVDCLRSERTNGPKWMWVLIILLGSLLGSVFYFVLGRRNQ